MCPNLGGAQSKVCVLDSPTPDVGVWRLRGDERRADGAAGSVGCSCSQQCRQLQQQRPHTRHRIPETANLPAQGKQRPHCASQKTYAMICACVISLCTRACARVKTTWRMRTRTGVLPEDLSPRTGFLLV